MIGELMWGLADRCRGKIPQFQAFPADSPVGAIQESPQCPRNCRAEGRGTSPQISTSLRGGQSPTWQSRRFSGMLCGPRDCHAPAGLAMTWLFQGGPYLSFHRISVQTRTLFLQNKDLHNRRLFWQNKGSKCERKCRICPLPIKIPFWAPRLCPSSC